MCSPSDIVFIMLKAVTFKDVEVEEVRYGPLEIEVGP